MSSKLAACLLNISEGRRPEVVWGVVAAAREAIQREAPKVEAVVLNAFVDQEYNRSVLTLAGRLGALEEGVVAAARETYRLVDLRQQEGGHPRLGAVDLIPFHPLTEATSMEDCGTLAARVATRLAEEGEGASFFLYGGAETEARGLVQRRREVGWFQSRLRDGVAPDLGCYRARAGVTGAGAAPFVANYNVTVGTEKREVGEEVLAKVRERSGGLLGVAAMAFPHKGGVEVRPVGISKYLFQTLLNI